jgi:hypothetical protein
MMNGEPAQAFGSKQALRQLRRKSSAIAIYEARGIGKSFINGNPTIG